jgi:cellulose synthase/poly-beta-1,6-N-acetylglucosamine synthase-like glycosyltransferase
MGILVAVLSVLLLLACLFPIVVDVLGVTMMRALPVLERLAPAAPERWPKVSVIIAACDEADTLRAAMAAKLAEDYPDLELVLVDDRSSDGTGAIVDEIAAVDERVRAIHVRALPAGWLGKLHAMQRGLDAASGEWILFSDADVHLAPGTIRRAIALCEERGHDFLAVVPEIPSSGLLDVLLAVLIRTTAVGMQARAIEDPRSSIAAGSGSFNLVRRSALLRTEGLAWLKLEVADDVALAQAVKRAGGRTAVASGRGMVKVAWYRA